MKSRLLGLAIALSLWTATPAHAQQSLVAQAKEDLRAHGFQVENAACTDFQIAKLVAGRIPGAGLLTKDCCGDGSDPNRSHCEFNGVWYAHDSIAFADGTLVDIAVDGGGANGPSYEVSPPDASVISRYRAAAALGLDGRIPGSTPAPAPAPTPVPVPPVVPPPVVVGMDYTAILERILESQQQLLTSQAALLDVSKNTNEHVVSMDRTLSQTLGSVGAFLGKYVAPAVAGYITAKQLTK